jgi:hypothetical protein
MEGEWKKIAVRSSGCVDKEREETGKKRDACVYSDKKVRYDQISLIPAVTSASEKGKDDLAGEGNLFGPNLPMTF